MFEAVEEGGSVYSSLGLVWLFVHKDAATYTGALVHRVGVAQYSVGTISTKTARFQL